MGSDNWGRVTDDLISVNVGEGKTDCVVSCISALKLELQKYKQIQRSGFKSVKEYHADLELTKLHAVQRLGFKSIEEAKEFDRAKRIVERHKAIFGTRREFHTMAGQMGGQRGVFRLVRMIF